MRLFLFCFVLGLFTSCHCRRHCELIKYDSEGNVTRLERRILNEHGQIVYDTHNQFGGSYRVVHTEESRGDTLLITEDNYVLIQPSLGFENAARSEMETLSFHPEDSIYTITWYENHFEDDNSITTNFLGDTALFQKDYDQFERDFRRWKNQRLSFHFDDTFNLYDSKMHLLETYKMVYVNGKLNSFALVDKNGLVFHKVRICREEDFILIQHCRAIDSGFSPFETSDSLRLSANNLVTWHSLNYSEDNGDHYRVIDHLRSRLSNLKPVDMLVLRRGSSMLDHMIINRSAYFDMPINSIDLRLFDRMPMRKYEDFETGVTKSLKYNLTGNLKSITKSDADGKVLEFAQIKRVKNHLE